MYYVEVDILSTVEKLDAALPVSPHTIFPTWDRWWVYKYEQIYCGS